MTSRAGVKPEAAYVAVGDELLLGDTVNSNAATVGRALAGVGVRVVRHIVVGDSQPEIVDALRQACALAPLVVVSGGLGPTEDDLTREAVAAYCERELIADTRIQEQLREKFAGLGRRMPERNLVQAQVIDGARVIDITYGTAPGQVVEHEGSSIYLLPGVPDELQDMLQRFVVNDVESKVGTGRVVSRVVNIAGVPESEISEKLSALNLPAGVSLAYLPSNGEVRVRLTVSVADEAAGTALLNRPAEEIRAIMGWSVVGFDDHNLDFAIANKLQDKGWSLGVAESLTGGGLGARCTRRAGASAWFRGSIVAYDASIKTSMLGVAQSIIDTHTVVSTQVAEAMAAGARRVLGSDVGIGITGVAGPDDQDKTAGTVCIAVETPLGASAREVRIPGDRERVRERSATAALIMLLRSLEG